MKVYFFVAEFTKKEHWRNDHLEGGGRGWEWWWWLKKVIILREDN